MQRRFLQMEKRLQYPTPNNTQQLQFPFTPPFNEDTARSRHFSRPVVPQRKPPFLFFSGEVILFGHQIYELGSFQLQLSTV